MEVWKPVTMPVDFSGLYEVSDLGRVRSLDRMLPRRGLARGRILRQLINRGRCAVSLYRDGRQLRIQVHTLVALHFLPRPDFDEEVEVAHLDDDRGNNAAANLEWTTHRKIVDHALDVGRFNPRIATRFQRKLDSKAASAIKVAKGRQIDIARRHGISRSMVSMIKSGKSWKEFHIPALAK